MWEKLLDARSKFTGNFIINKQTDCYTCIFLVENLTFRKSVHDRSFQYFFVILSASIIIVLFKERTPEPAVFRSSNSAWSLFEFHVNTDRPETERTEGIVHCSKRENVSFRCLQYDSHVIHSTTHFLHRSWKFNLIRKTAILYDKTVGCNITIVWTRLMCPMRQLVKVDYRSFGSSSFDGIIWLIWRSTNRTTNNKRDSKIFVLLQHKIQGWLAILLIAIIPLTQNLCLVLLFHLYI